jgi:hypothetical protein
MMKNACVDGPPSLAVGTPPLARSHRGPAALACEGRCCWKIGRAGARPPQRAGPPLGGPVYVCLKVGGERASASAEDPPSPAPRRPRGVIAVGEGSLMCHQAQVGDGVGAGSVCLTRANHHLRPLLSLRTCIASCAWCWVLGVATLLRTAARRRRRRARVRSG